MKVIIIAVFLAIALPHANHGQTAGKKRGQNTKVERTQIPVIRLLYPSGGTIFDRTCPQFLKTQINPEWVQETARRVPEFQALWDKHGPAYLSVTFAEIGLGFPYGEMQAALTVCPVSSMSIPLMINVRAFLSSEQSQVPPEHFAEVVFHELMHHYTQRVNASSALRKKYAKEPPVVLSHLHVMAIEKFVLLKLGRTEELKYLDYQYRNNPPPSFYKRAWEIVNDIEGYESFIKEMKLLQK
ncbi:MAG TPA: hypothetical protein VF131_14210 [Blastocatellia bacterium]|nr:hypothetical protein [Blastocatellia bacterium]